MPIIGIDLGTTNSLAAVWRDGKSCLVPTADGTFLMPSVVSVDDDGSILVGQAAKERLISHPEMTAASFKRAMGSSKLFELGERSFMPEELSSLVLRRLWEHAEAFLGEAVTEAVISVPAYFSDRQRAATKRAGQMAGLKVERIINEPSAAALACRLSQYGGDSMFLVFDFGGGTLDVSLVDCFDNVVSIVAVAGDNRLGGNDFDEVIAQQFCRVNNLEYSSMGSAERAILLRGAEQCKTMLTMQDTVTMVLSCEEISGSLTLSNQQLIELSYKLLRRVATPIERILTDSRMSMAEIDQIVTVGGSCHMPVIRQYLKKLLGKEPVTIGSPDTIVALGVGAYAGIKERSEQLREIVLTDICPFTLGIGTYNAENPHKDLMSPVIERNSTLPSSKISRYYTVHDGQNVIRCYIYQGEAYYADDNIQLGKIEIAVPCAPKEKEWIDLRFTYDINGILEAEATNSQGKTERVVILNESTISKAEAEKRLQMLTALKIHPRDKESNRALLARGERLFSQSLGIERGFITTQIQRFEHALETQEPRAVAQCYREVAQIFDRLEQNSIQFGDLDDGFDFDDDSEVIG